MATMREAVKTSVDAAVRSGRIDKKAQAAPLEMLYTMADAIDSANGDPAIFRSVTPHHFMAYCEKLGLMPGEEQAATRSTGALVALKTNAKWAANA